MTRKEDILDAMAGAYWFLTMDLMSAYYQVRMREENIKFTAFQAPNGLWEYLVLPMGVCNAPATMHRLTSKMFRGMENTKSFYDDIYIFTKSPRIEEHLGALRKALDILRDNKLYVKLSKCLFCTDEIPCLGDFVGRNGVRMDPDKVQTIKDWPVPRTQEKLHSFLGLTGYVQRFCPAFATLTASMFNLLKKKTKRNAKIHFDDEQLKNFKELKRRLCNPPVLYLPDFTLPMHIRTDTSKFAVGGVLFQVVDGVERPIVYTSRKMKSAELNYPTQQQELLAIVHALAAFRIYCLDKPPIVETDHKSLEGLFTQKMANRRLARWYDILAEYQPTFSYLPGAKNGIADVLSRRPDLQPDTKFFHDLSVTSFDDTSFQLEITEVTTDGDLVKDIKAEYAKDREIRAILAAINDRAESEKHRKSKQQRKMYRHYTKAKDAAETRPLLSFMQAGNHHVNMRQQRASVDHSHTALAPATAAKRPAQRPLTVHAQVALLAARVLHGALVVRVVAGLAREALLVGHGGDSQLRLDQEADANRSAGDHGAGAPPRGRGRGVAGQRARGQPALQRRHQQHVQQQPERQGRRLAGPGQPAPAPAPARRVGRRVAGRGGRGGRHDVLLRRAVRAAARGHAVPPAGQPTTAWPPSACSSAASTRSP
ncbi:hypothetical protein ON010_g16230 [Phytophthora cinnamomi]|nr:hypothetical protein ON010_g16230 [Phytophthora cinnamomi]